MTGYRASRAVQAWQYAGALLVVCIATTGLVGWLVGMRSLAGQIATYNAMVPITAVCLIIFGAAFLLRLALPDRVAITRAAAAAIFAIIVLELTDVLTGLHVAPDRLFAAATELSGARQIGRMSPAVAVCLAALGVALVLSSSTRPLRRSASHILALVIGNVGFVLCVGYAYNTPLLYSAMASPPALPTSFALAILGFACALLTADRFPLRVFVGDSVRPQLLRAVLPTLVGTIIAFAMLDVVDNRLGIEHGPLVTSVVFLVSIVAVSVTVLRSTATVGRSVEGADQALRTASMELASSNTALEHMVHDVAGAMGRVVEARDPYTKGHEERVAIISRLIAEDLGLPSSVVEGIEMAALLHDIGKLHIPAEILTKPGRLSAAEFDLIKEHPRQGFAILKDIAFPWQISDAVLQHHERTDGSGYPMGLRGDEILPAARILAVADTIEAMASDRPYRPAIGIGPAIAEIRENSERYDPAVVASCIGLYDRGQLVFAGPVEEVAPAEPLRDGPASVRAAGYLPVRVVTVPDGP